MEATILNTLPESTNLILQASKPGFCSVIIPIFIDEKTKAWVLRSDIAFHILRSDLASKLRSDQRGHILKLHTMLPSYTT